MADIVSWVSDRLHEIIGLSDKQVAEYITELARKSVSLTELTNKLRRTGTITMTKSVEVFAAELWNKFPREEAQFSNRSVDTKQEKKVYKLILDDPLEEAIESHTGLRGKKSRNIRLQKSTSWESDEEDMCNTRIVNKDEGSDSDEWERYKYYIGLKKKFFACLWCAEFPIHLCCCREEQAHLVTTGQFFYMFICDLHCTYCSVIQGF